MAGNMFDVEFTEWVAFCAVCPPRAICGWPLIMAVRNTHAEAERRHAERNYRYSKLHLPGVPKMIVSDLGGVGASGQLRDVG